MEPGGLHRPSGSTLADISLPRNRTIRPYTPPGIQGACGAVLLALALASSSFGAIAAERASKQDKEQEKQQDQQQEKRQAQDATSADQLPQGQDVDDMVIELAGWVVASNDSQGYPFAIMDKASAQILVFGGDGKLRGAAPGLFGSAIGDHTAPGVAGLALREIPGRDRTTPAGRFVGGYGPSIDAGRVLWVDYDSAVSIHPTATGVPSERRVERLASPTPDDNRVTHGCINVAPGFYERIMQPTFEKGGVFYILPEKDTLEATFPEFAQGRGNTERKSGRRARAARN